MEQLRLRENAAVVVIRCTKKLLRRVGPPALVVERSTTRLGDWYANLVGVGPQRFVLLVSERARLPVVLRARDVRNLRKHLPPAVGEVLAGLGVSVTDIAQEIAEMQEAAIATTASRSVIGSMNDFSKAISWRIRDEPDADLIAMALWLAETPILVLDGKSPDQLAPALFG